MSSGKPLIICCAITGTLPQKTDNPAIPITVSEQVESTQEAFEAGATIAHCHVRNDDGSPSGDPEKFALLLESFREHCPGLIVQFSTGNRRSSSRDRGAMLSLKPDMASLSVGSTNFPNSVYENPPELINWLAAEMTKNDITPEIEAFDLSHIHQAVLRHEAGQLPGKLYVQFVMGVKNSMPADREVFNYYVETMQRLAPDAEWCAAGIGRHQSEVNEWAISAGGHTRTGFEDNIRLDRNTLAPSNAALVKRVCEIAETHNRPIASAAQAREILGLAEFAGA